MKSATNWCLILLFIAGIALSGCGSAPAPQAAKPEPKIVIASKPFAEQFILAHMAAEVLKAKAKVAGRYQQDRHGAQ